MNIELYRQQIMNLYDKFTENAIDRAEFAVALSEATGRILRDTAEDLDKAREQARKSRQVDKG